MNTVATMIVAIITVMIVGMTGITIVVMIAVGTAIMTTETTIDLSAPSFRAAITALIS
ncbi:hypothetical protein PSH69_12825 [Pseudomonas sp. FP1740]|nr:hypothetical protein [Pseudomonas sp. FP1740]WLG47435.1 hypothetical protein PSH69_12825 [Pseudomonas sp. FP1740]